MCKSSKKIKKHIINLSSAKFVQGVVKVKGTGNVKISFIIVHAKTVTFTTFWKKTTDDKLLTFFLLFPENGIKNFMLIVFIGDNLHEMFNPDS